MGKIFNKKGNYFRYKIECKEVPFKQTCFEVIFSEGVKFIFINDFPYLKSYNIPNEFILFLQLTVTIKAGTHF